MFNLTFSNANPIIIIDNSYYIFNRYYATIRWFKQKDENNEIDHKNIIENKEFIIAFIKHFEADMKKIIRKFKTIKSNIIFCVDCPRSTIWRNTIYDKYKQTRIKKDNFNSDIFDLFEDYLTKNNYKICKFDNLEADDIVYLMQNKLNKIANIIIITNDSDYLQMYSNNVKIFNMQFKDLSLKINYSPNIELLLKIIMGDKSDNISKIQMGMRKDNAIRIALMTDEDRNVYLNNNNIIDAFNLNKTLIDFNEIPDLIVKNFYEYYNISIQ
jgi:5'-3' exonuclease